MPTDVATALQRTRIGDFPCVRQYFPQETAVLDNLVYAGTTQAASGAKGATASGEEVGGTSADDTNPTSSHVRLWIRDIPFPRADTCGSALLELHFPEPTVTQYANTLASHASVSAANVEYGTAGDISSVLPALAAFLQGCCAGTSIQLYQEVDRESPHEGADGTSSADHGASFGTTTEQGDEEELIEYRKVEPLAGVESDK